MNTATRISPSNNGFPEPSANGTNGTPKPQPKHPDRDANGRFIKGNPGGVGNPFGRQVAQLRKELVNRLTTEKMGEIADRLIRGAICGDWVAAKLLFSYVFGKPAESVDPDRVDLDEFELFKRQAAIPAEAPAVMASPEPVFSLDLIRTMRPLWNQFGVKELRDELQEEQDEYEREQALEAIRREPRRQKKLAKEREKPAAVSSEPKDESPSTNGKSVEESPSTNGGSEMDSPSTNGESAGKSPSTNGKSVEESPSTIGDLSAIECQIVPNMDPEEAQGLLDKLLGKLSALGCRDDNRDE